MAPRPERTSRRTLSPTGRSSPRTTPTACSGWRNRSSSDVVTSPMALLELTDISKSFGGVQALRNVDFTLNAGEIHGLAGENGAGKSTMMKIIAGVHGADSGTMRVDGKEVHF